MKRTLVYSALALAIAFTVACKKKKHDIAETPTDELPAAPTYGNYSQLKVGNYWIYEEVQVSGQQALAVHNDSCYISKDTVIRNQTYYKYHNSANTFIYPGNYFFIRDSLHYTIDLQGNILFSSEDFTTVFKTSFEVGMGTDTLAKITNKMEDKDVSVTTAAGTFITSDLRQSIKFYPDYGNITTIRHRRCAKNIGVVIESNLIYFSIPDYVIERRLLRYHLN